LYRDCEIGSLELKQQDLSGAVTDGVPLSSMFIRSHWDCVFGVAHSVIFEERKAHAESGTSPTPTRLNVIAKIRTLLNVPALANAPSSDLHPTNLAYQIPQKLAVTSLTAGCDSRHHLLVPSESVSFKRLQISTRWLIRRHVVPRNEPALRSCDCQHSIFGSPSTHGPETVWCREN
jgi:hypothetical protein